MFGESIRALLYRQLHLIFVVMIRVPVRSTKRISVLQMQRCTHRFGEHVRRIVGGVDLLYYYGLSIEFLANLVIFLSQCLVLVDSTTSSESRLTA